MGRLLAILVFATAAAAATYAGAGVVVASHTDPPGTHAIHSHLLAAYRLPLFLGVLRARWDPHQGLMSQQGVMELETTLVMALLSLLWPRLPRPTLVAVAEFAGARIAREIWQTPLILGPPRSHLHV